MAGAGDGDEEEESRSGMSGQDVVPMLAAAVAIISSTFLYLGSRNREENITERIKIVAHAVGATPYLPAALEALRETAKDRAQAESENPTA